MDSTTFTAHSLDRHRAAQLERENAIIRSQRERQDVTAVAPTARAGVFARILHPLRTRSAHRVAAAH